MISVTVKPTPETKEFLIDLADLCVSEIEWEKLTSKEKDALILEFLNYSTFQPQWGIVKINKPLS